MAWFPGPRDNSVADPINTTGPLTDEEFQSIVSSMLTDCALLVDTELSPERAKNTDYYLGKPFGNEEAGRSQVVSTDVRDGVQAVMPQLLRVFYGTADHVLEFIPVNADPVKVKQAEQATDYVQWVIEQENDGFIQTHSVLKDGLIRKQGVFKWAWEESEEVRAYSVENIIESDIELLASDDDITITRIVQMDAGKPPFAEQQFLPSARQIPPKPEGADPNNDNRDALIGNDENPRAEDADSGPGSALQASPPRDSVSAGWGAGTLASVPATANPIADKAPAPGSFDREVKDIPPGMVPLYRVELTRCEKGGRVKVWALPPEEFIFTREARTIDDALCVAHRTYKRKGELVAMGVPEHIVDEYGQLDATLRLNQEDVARRRVIDNAGSIIDPGAGAANDKVLYCESYAKIDFDGDGIAELRKICTLGPTFWVYSNEPFNERPFAIFCPDPEPHTMLGLSWADRLMDMQKIKSSLIRGMLDSMSASLFPRQAYQEGMVNVTDLLNTEIGSTIRTKGPPSQVLEAYTMPFTGKDVLPITQYMDEVIERRTGQSEGTTGLDADALQSSTPDAVTAQITAAQGVIEVLARIFAETCYKPLMKGIYRLLVQHQPRKRVIRLRGEWTEVDPRLWDADMDVQVNVALGTGSVDRKVGMLVAAAQKQEAIIKELGPNNPICPVNALVYTYQQIMQLQGFKDSQRYFAQPPKGWQPPPPPPSPEMAQVQLETQKAQAKIQLELQQLKLKQAEAAARNDVENKKVALDAVLRREQINAQFKTDYTEQQTEQDAGHAEMWLDMQKQAHDQALSRQQQFHDQALARQQQQHEQLINAHKAALAQQAQQHAQAMAELQAANAGSSGTSSGGD